MSILITKQYYYNQYLSLSLTIPGKYIIALLMRLIIILQIGPAFTLDYGQHCIMHFCFRFSGRLLFHAAFLAVRRYIDASP